MKHDNPFIQRGEPGITFRSFLKKAEKRDPWDDADKDQLMQALVPVLAPLAEKAGVKFCVDCLDIKPGDKESVQQALLYIWRMSEPKSGELKDGPDTRLYYFIANHVEEYCQGVQIERIPYCVLCGLPKGTTTPH